MDSAKHAIVTHVSDPIQRTMLSYPLRQRLSNELSRVPPHLQRRIKPIVTSQLVGIPQSAGCYRIIKMVQQLTNHAQRTAEH